MDTKIIKSGSQVFGALAEADAFCDQKETEGFDHIVVLSNTPSVGLFTASWGREVPMTYEESHNELFDSYAKMYEEREQEVEDDFTRDCERSGRSVVARQFAESNGYKEGSKERKYFVQAFCGESIKRANPKADGMTDIFKAGCAAWNSKEGQRLYRVESVKQRSIHEKPAVQPIHYPGG